MLHSSLVFTGWRPASTEEADHIREMVVQLSTPAPRKWIAGRVLTLLSQYFAPNMDEGVSAAIADDWCAMLADYPAWAIANACRWWMSRENPNKHRRPLPGDIQDRAHVEMERVRVARMMLQRGVEAPKEPEPKRSVTPEDMERRRQFAEEDMVRRRQFAEEIMAKFRGAN